MQQALDAGLDLDEGAEVSEATHAAGDDLVLAQALVEVVPGIGLELLLAEADATAALLDAEDLDLDLVAHLDELLGALDAAVGHVRHVQQAFDPADVDEGAVGLEARDLAAHHAADVDALHALVALALLLGLEHRAPRDDHALLVAVELDDLADQRLSAEGGQILDVVERHLRGREEGTRRGDLQLEAALVHADHDALHQGADLEVVPGGQGLGLAGGEEPHAVFATAQGELDLGADLGGRLELLGRDDALGARPQLDHHVGAVDPDDGGFEEGAALLRSLGGLELGLELGAQGAHSILTLGRHGGEGGSGRATIIRPPPPAGRGSSGRSSVKNGCARPATGSGRPPRHRRRAG